ncbi:putative hydrolase [Antricoccus suffuscus]|uniref:Putative hydrolase n=1 Tax=Antricoccus suffuscus TaxID=1629062 RepID=A0A2T0ZQA7_9ACTN|nr:zinc-dependent metalloprotease [Antricoccus suffuscus]PRZ38536.1 putative hydrolase [Antricoccus suffuscus]
MTKPPFGFSASGPDDPDDSDHNSEHHDLSKNSGDASEASSDSGQDQSGNPFANNPFGFMFPGFGGTPGTPGSGPQLPPGMQMPGGMPMDLNAAMPFIQQLQQMFSQQSGPVNWDLAKQGALAHANANQRSLTAADKIAVKEAVHLADLWLNEATTFPSGVTTTASWTRAEWIEHTLPVWSQLCDPVAAQLVSAMSAMIPTNDEQQMPAGFPGFEGIMGTMGGMIFGTQVGQAIAQLASEVLSSTDVGLPLGPAGTAVLLPQNVDAFSEGLEIGADEIRLYLALREVTYQRLFAHVPWLKQRVLNTVEAYAKGIVVDKDAIERSISEIDPADLQSNPEKLQEIFSSGVFEPETTEAQKQSLASLETLLALIEGWVDRVVTKVAGDRLPAENALGEMMRRRRAAGGPAEQTFATLVGLELRPRRLREAAKLWAEIEKRRGVEGRDAIWEHPDLLPSSSDLDHPEAFADMTSNSSFTDADFDALLRGDDNPADEPADTAGTDSDSDAGTDANSDNNDDRPDDSDGTTQV